MRCAKITVPLLSAVIAVAPLHDAIDGLAHGPDPQEPARTPQARIVAYTSTQTLDPAHLAAFLKSLRRPCDSEKGLFTLT